MDKCYIEICYTYENRGNNSFSPPVAIVEVEAEDGEFIKNLINKAMDRIKEKYPDKTLYMIDGRYLGDSLEIITI